jgi:hypothetical protein
MPQLPLPQRFVQNLPQPPDPTPFDRYLSDFQWEGRSTDVVGTTVPFEGGAIAVDTYVNEFWTSRQRAAHSLHEISYRACFKPQLPRFFIERLTQPGDTVYDPFMGRGTTVVEAALLGRAAVGCDINPLSSYLVAPRLQPPPLDAVRQRLRRVKWTREQELPDELLTFYHPETLREICALRTYLLDKSGLRSFDNIDTWIRMVAVNRLTGHSPGFFSVYTLPPNQAVSIAAQKKINANRNQAPPQRSVPTLILTKSRALLSDLEATTRTRLNAISGRHKLLTAPAAATAAIPSASVQLIVTSPPFLDVVDYAGDNWLRCWFCGINPESVELTVPRKIADWCDAMASVFTELHRVLVPGGHIAFEVGEIRGGRLRLEEHVIPCGVRAGLQPRLVVINAQRFTKTAACWGVDNNRKGTNTNRIVLFQKT